MGASFPNESAEHRAARDRLLEQEIQLRRATEVVAAARRALPPGGLVPEDYTFDGLGHDRRPARVRLSDLFAPRKHTLIVYHFMFPRAAHDDRPLPADSTLGLGDVSQAPCPSCSALLDALDGAAPHVMQHANLAVVAKAPLQQLLALAQERGWRHLRLLSTAGNRFRRDYLAESSEGSAPLTTVFRRDGSRIRHVWSSELAFAPADAGQDSRCNGTLDLLWNLLDLTPEGRPANWREQLSYAVAPRS